MHRVVRYLIRIQREVLFLNEGAAGRNVFLMVLSKGRLLSKGVYFITINSIGDSSADFARTLSLLMANVIMFLRVTVS